MNKKILALLSLIFTLSAHATDYDKIVARLQDVSKKPHTALFSLGKNDQGIDILGVVIGDPAVAKTKHLIVGTHHGNERAAAELPFLFIDRILADYNQDVLFYVIPVLNISGYNVSRREETGSDQKTHDPNRDYEDACDTKHDFQLKSTSLIADFIGRENVIAAVTLHGYVGSFTYPWGTFVKPYETLDESLMADLGKKSIAFNNYKTGTHGDIVYPAAGAFEDWAYLKHGVWSYLLEIRSPYSDLKKDAAALVEFFKRAPTERSSHVGQKVNCVEHILKAAEKSRP